MQTTIDSIYSLFINDGWSLNQNGVLKKNSRQVLPDSLRRTVGTTLDNFELAAQITDSNASDIYAGIVAKFRNAIDAVSNDSDSDPETIDITKFLPDRTEVLSSEIVEYCKKNAVYSRDSMGTFVYLARHGTTGNQWRLINDFESAIITSPNVAEFKKLYVKLNQSPLRGSEFEVYNTDGSVFNVMKWDRVVDIAIAKASKYIQEHPEENLILPSLAFRTKYRNARTLNPKEDPTVIPSMSSQINETGRIAELWQTHPELCVDMPATITNDPNKSAFCFVDLEDFKEKSDTPEFDGFMSSIDPAVRGPFMACIYACVYEPCHHTLVVWMHGEGANGKSQFFAAMNDYFGGTLVGSMSTKTLAGEFGLEGLIGKRIIIWGDCQNGNALSTNEVHGITGGDSMSVNRKNKPIINYTFRSLLFIGANQPPKINLNAVNETRRVLYVPMGDPDIEVMRKYCKTNPDGSIMRHSTGQPMFKSYDLKGKLIAEMPAIMAKCKEEFDKYCVAPYNQITVPREAFELMTSKCESGQNLVFNDFMVSQCAITGKDSDFVSAFDVNQRYVEHVYGLKSSKQHGKYSYELGDLKRFILTSHSNVTFTRRVVDGTKISGYIGMRFGANVPISTVGFGSEEDDDGQVF